MSKKKQIKKEVKNSVSCDCAAAIGILLGLLVVAAGTYYLCLPNLPEPGACYKHKSYDGFAVVKELWGDDEYVSYYYTFPYRTEDNNDKKSRTIEEFNELYPTEVDYSSCLLADDLLATKKTVEQYKNLLHKKAEK